MSQCFACLLFVLLFINTTLAQDPSSPPPTLQQEDKVIIVSNSVNIQCTLIITGCIVAENTDPCSGTLLQTIIEKIHPDDQGGGWVENTKDEALSKSISKAIWSTIASLAHNDNLAVQQMEPEHTKVATFTLYLAVHSSGNVKHSKSTGTVYDNKACQYSGMAHVSYLPSYTPTIEEESISKFHDIMHAILPLADKLACAIWIKTKADEPTSSRLEEKTGVVWGGEDSWCQEVTQSTGKK